MSSTKMQFTTLLGNRVLIDISKIESVTEKKLTNESRANILMSSGELIQVTASYETVAAMFSDP